MSPFPSALPDPRVTPLRGGPVVRWGVLGPGRIAADFTDAVHAFTDQRVVAVGSRSAERARAFAEPRGITRVHGDYEQLVSDPEVDVVYIATPHSEHRENALLAIAAGKHVLVEKPIAVTAAEARDIRDAAVAAGVFAGEAMWSRYLPQTDVLVRLVADGGLGELRLVTADFSGRSTFDPASRAWDPALGGGALLDLGVYVLWFAHLFLGAPERVTAAGSLAPTGVDAQASLLLEYAGGAQAMLATSLLFASPNGALVCGTEGRVAVDPMFLAPGGFTVTPSAGALLRYADDSGFVFRDGLAWEAPAVAGYVAEGRTDSPVHPLSAAIEVLDTIDEARRQLGAI
jgi:predicted dehydrogenase